MNSSRQEESPCANSGCRSASIGHIAEVLPGFSPKGAIEHRLDGTHQIISPRRLTAGEPYRFLPEHVLRITPERDVSGYLIRPGDVLFISRGTRNVAVKIESVPERTITTATFYILRVTSDRILPDYLAWCINQPPIQAILDEIRTGAGTPLVPRSAFSQIPIPVPSLDKQRTIKGLALLQSRERRLVQRIMEETEAMHRTMGAVILHAFAQQGAKE